MATPQELEELFAYLDKLELDEQLEQEKAEAVDLPLTVSKGRDFRNDLVSIDAIEARVGEIGHVDDLGDRMATLLEDAEPAPKVHATDPSTPPRRKIVQFNAVTPMKTPQRKAPKLVFTPLRPVQPADPPETQMPIESAKFATEYEESSHLDLEGVVLSPADSSFRRSYFQDSPSTNPQVELERAEILDDLSEASFIIRASASPPASSRDSTRTYDVKDSETQAADLPSPVPSPVRPRRQLKKRVVYSSDEESEHPGVMVPPSTQADEVIDVEAIGDGPYTKLEVDGLNPKTKQTRTTRTKAKKKSDVAKFFDTMARSTDNDSEDDDSDDAGSLDDFIVDDDYVEYEDENSEDDYAYVLTYSPTTPKPRKKAAPMASVTVDLTETSDEDHVDPVPNIYTAARPKPRPRAPPARLQPPETPRKSRTEKKSWNENKQKLAMDIMQELDELVFEDKLVKEWKVAPVWNNKLLTTAGRAHHKRMKQSDGSYKHEGRIELSEKVIDDEGTLRSTFRYDALVDLHSLVQAKLKNTVAHEMCHLATWIISGEMKNPHGAIFKSWGKKVMKTRRDIEVTTKHSYEIVYKYEWECITDGCDAIYRRHSKSIDTETQACGKCRGRLRPLFKTRATGAGSTPFQEFLKQNMKLAKAAMPKATHGEVMRALSERWKATGGAKTPAEIVQAGEDPIAVQRAHAEYWQVMSLQMQGLSIA